MNAPWPKPRMELNFHFRAMNFIKIHTKNEKKLKIFQPKKFDTFWPFFFLFSLLFPFSGPLILDKYPNGQCDRPQRMSSNRLEAEWKISYKKKKNLAKKKKRIEKINRNFSYMLQIQTTAHTFFYIKFSGYLYSITTYKDAKEPKRTVYQTYKLHSQTQQQQHSTKRIFFFLVFPFCKMIWET